MSIIKNGKILITKKASGSNERICIIKLMPDNNIQQMDVKTGGVTNLEIVDRLSALSKHFATAVIADYVKITGDKKADPDKLDEYMNFLRDAKL